MKMHQPVLQIISVMVIAICAQTWTDISTSQINSLGGSSAQSYPGGVAGTCVNRLTGDVFINIVGFGIWKSVNQGSAWTKYSGTTISGRCENGWGVQISQDDPTRMAVFSLDGDAGYTLNGGSTWKKFTQVWGRNWDYGSVDWANPAAKTIIAMDHENSGVTRKSIDGGTTWTDLGIRLSTDVWGSGPMTIGCMDSTTFIYSNASGIQRSTNLGSSWTQVSTEKPLGKVVVLFKGKHYLGTSTGLIVSADKGLTWQHQGASLNIYQGPYFGADENSMVVAGSPGIYKSTNAGTSWTKIGDFPTQSASGFGYNVLWFGSNTWDPINNTLYATAMANPAFKKQLAATGVTRNINSTLNQQGLTIANSTLRSDKAFGHLQIFSLAGSLLLDKHVYPTNALKLPALGNARRSSLIYRIRTVDGRLEQLVR
jgi:hypothetical protein